MRKFNQPAWLQKILLILGILGPGLITASAGNDAPGIATYSSAGSNYGYTLLWVMVVIAVACVAVQEMAARMGAVTGKGTADLIRERFGLRITSFAMASLLIANLGTTIAEFAGIAAAGEIFGISRYITVPLAGLLFSLLILRGNYGIIEKVLLVLTLSAFAYVISVFIVKPDMQEILEATFRPQITLTQGYVTTVLAAIGTTIAPWAIFYLQASVADKGRPLNKFWETRLDTVFGAVLGNMVSIFIIILTAATLFKSGVRVETAEAAAQALRPFAGAWATPLFAAGLLGASLLAVSVLPLSTTYAFCEAFGFERGLNRPMREAPAFYTIFIAITGLAVAITLLPGVPLFQLMIFSQAVNAMLLPVTLVLALVLANDSRIMGKHKNGAVANILLISVTALVLAATAALVVLPLINPI